MQAIKDAGEREGRGGRMEREKTVAMKKKGVEKIIIIING